MEKVYSGRFPSPPRVIPDEGGNSSGPNHGPHAQTTTGTKAGADAGRARRDRLRAAALAAPARAPRGRRPGLGSFCQIRPLEQGAELLGLEQVPARAAFGQAELGEDRGRGRVAGVVAPLALEPLPQLGVAVVAL